MTREEISQAAEDYAKNYGYFNCETGDVFIAFEDGSKWALSNMWHSVADGDLPKGDILENNTLVCFGSVFGFEYNVQYMNGAFGAYIPPEGYEVPEDFIILDGVEYWMEIREIKRS